MNLSCPCKTYYYEVWIFNSSELKKNFYRFNEVSWDVWIEFKKKLSGALCTRLIRKRSWFNQKDYFVPVPNDIKRMKENVYGGPPCNSICVAATLHTKKKKKHIDSGLEKKRGLPRSLGQVDFLVGQVTCKAY